MKRDFKMRTNEEMNNRFIAYRSYSLNNFACIPQINALTAEQQFDIKVIGTVFPFKVNNYVVNELINWGNVPDDPIFRLTFPQKGMLAEQDYAEIAGALNRNASKEEIKEIANRIRLRLNPHPAGQMELNVPEVNGVRLRGIQHKYPQTVLFFPGQGQTCHAYCTFCFRWPQFVGMDDMKFATRDVEMLTNYIQNNKEVTDVLFTGGDPLIMSTANLHAYMDHLLLTKPENLQTIRLGTKALGYWPYRFILDKDADDLLRLFERIVKSGINLSIMAHFTHPAELETRAVKEAISRVRNTGTQIRTQSPVLRNINDDPGVWADMWRKQVNLNCIPYYMFIPRDTGAQGYFAVPLVQAWNIFRKAYRQVSGICRTVRGPSMSCTWGKIQLLGVSEIPMGTFTKKVMTLRFLQARNPDWVARPFFAEYDEKAIWIDDLRPAFTDEGFFFEETKAKLSFENQLRK